MSDVYKVIASTALIAYSGLAFAQGNNVVLERIDGTVMVNQGQSYTAGREGMVLKEGDLVMVPDQAGKGVVSFPDGCDHTVTVENILRVQGSSPCAIAAATGGAAAAAPAAAAGATAPLVIGGLAVLCVAACFDSNGNQISPEQ